MFNLNKVLAGVALVAVLFMPFEAGAVQTVQVTGRVGSVNLPPAIVTVVPSAWTFVQKNSTVKAMTVYFTDGDDTTVTWTVTPTLATDKSPANANTGSTNIESGTVTDVTSSGSSYAQFNYIAPSTTGYVYLTVTANDGKVVTTASYTIYVY